METLEASAILVDSGCGPKSTVAGAGIPPTDNALSRARVMRLQRAAGNGAVAELLKRQSTVGRGSEPSVPTTKPVVQRDPPTPTNTGTAPAPAVDAAQLGPSGPLGEVEFNLPNISIFDRKEKPKNWDKEIASATAFTIPIPDLPGITLSLGARGRAFAYFNAWFGPVQLQNLRVGMSKKQATILAAGALSPIAAPAAGAAVFPVSPVAGAALALFGGPAARIAALYTLYKGPFKASAQLFAPVGGTVRFGAAASFSANAEFLAKYSLVMLDAGVEGSVNLNLDVSPPGAPPTIQINYADGDVDFAKTLELAANVKLDLLLNAFIRAEVGRRWAWTRTWETARTPLDKSWPLKPSLKIENKRGGGGAQPNSGGNPLTNSMMGSIGDTEVEFILDELTNDRSAVDFLMNAMTDGKRANEKEKKEPLPGQDQGPRAKHFQPIGTKDDPILVSWYKPPHWYADPIHLDVGKGKQAFRRDERAMLPNGQGIGVQHWPRVGEVFLITGIPTTRSGTQQAAFRKTLEQYGFPWAGWEADHVWDVGLGGFDDFYNLWPLEKGVNNRAGNRQLFQTVQYNKPDDPPGTRRVPTVIKDHPDLMSKYFKIRDFREP